MPDSSPHIEPEFVMPSHETLRAWCVRARSGEGSPYVHISPDELEGLLGQLEVLREFYDAWWANENGIVDFDLHHSQVERLRAAANAAFRLTHPDA